MEGGLRNYLVVTGGYWAFTVTGGANRMLVVLTATAILLPSGVGKMKSKPKFNRVFSNRPEINWLAAARFFLFGWVYQTHGLAGFLWWSAGFVLAAALLSFKLPEVSAGNQEPAVV